MTAEPSRAAFRLNLLAATAVMLGGIWASSGTLAPYAATLDAPIPWPPCGYLVNIDHAHFEATWHFLRGLPKDVWEFSVVLRRMLFPLLAYPLMKLAGFIAGGILTSVALHVAALLAMALHLRRISGQRCALVAAWLLATYPGVTYWAALPYSYAIIVPGSIFCMILLSRMETTASSTQAVAAAAGIGVLATGYDFLPIFGVTAIGILAIRRKFTWLPGAVVCLLAPTATVLFWIHSRGAPLSNANSDIYGNIARAWLQPAWAEWLVLLRSVPSTAVITFFNANFIFLPALFICCVLLNLVRPRASWNWAELGVLSTAAVAFLFVNAAPPNTGVQIRGTNLARLYQPVFAAMLPFIGRFLQATRRTTWAVLPAALLGASVCYGGLLHNPLTGPVYIRFYRHAAPESFERNLIRYGRRPFGICKPG